jgi:hypothetical protein
MSTIINWEGKPFALLIEDEDGPFLVPPIVLDDNNTLVGGRDLLVGLVETGISADPPVVRASTPGALADIDQHMAAISERLGVPIGLPDRARRN